MRFPDLWINPELQLLCDCDICYSDNCLTQKSSLIFDKFALKMTNCCSSISSSHNVNVKLVLLAVLVYGKVNYLFNCWSIWKSRGQYQHWYQGVKHSHSDISADIRAERINRVIQITQLGYFQSRLIKTHTLFHTDDYFCCKIVVTAFNRLQGPNDEMAYYQ